MGQPFSDISALLPPWDTRLELPLKAGQISFLLRQGETLLNDMSKRLLSPTELKMNCVLLTQKTPVRYEKQGNTAFFLALHSYKDVVLIFISVSHYLMLLFEHVTETIQSSPAFCH